MAIITENFNLRTNSVSIAFTDGDTSRRVTITDANALITSIILGNVRRPDTIDDSADKGYIYHWSMVKMNSGNFDIDISVHSWGFEDPVENPPNETVTFFYILG